jgi:hypothetical protein
MSTDETESGNRQPIDLHGIITPAPVAVAVPGDAECVVHNLQTGETYRLDEVGAKIWELLEMGRSAADIQAQLCAEYRLPEGVSPRQVESDVALILTQLHEYGLLTVGP